MTEILWRVFSYFLLLFLLRVAFGKERFERQVFLFPLLALVGVLTGMWIAVQLSF